MDITKLTKFSDFVSLKTATEESIATAEHNLGVKFAPEYKDYLKTYGLAFAAGIEFTGLVDDERLNVVDATNFARQYCRIPQNMYVIYDPNIDNVLILQDEDGLIYEWSNSHIKQVASNFVEFIQYETGKTE